MSRAEDFVKNFEKVSKVITDNAPEDLIYPCDIMQKEVQRISKLKSEKIDNWILTSVVPRFRLEVDVRNGLTEYKLFTKYGKKEISKIIL